MQYVIYVTSFKLEFWRYMVEFEYFEFEYFLPVLEL